MKRRPWFVMVFLLLAYLGTLPCDSWAEEGEALHLAVACPLSGRNSANGHAVTQGVRLYFDAVNRLGGVNGKKIVLDFYDDEDRGAKAEETAEAIVADNRALAVIGHESSSCSMAAGPVYKDAEMVALSPTSTDVRVTKDNPWYFRMTFNNDFQGEFLAHYIHQVFGEKVVSVIHEDLAYGAKLSEVFQGKARELGLSVARVWPFEVGDPELPARLETIVGQILEAGEAAGMLFVALHPPEGRELIIRLREAGVKNPVFFAAGLSSPDFLKQFADMPQEARNPGYYTNGMYAASGVIFDTADEKVKAFMEDYRAAYGEAPNRRAAFAYDAAGVLHEALVKTGVSGENPREDRRQIRQWLAQVDTPLKAVEGVTGLTSFNADGDPHKPITVGLFKNRQLISAPVQLREVRCLSEIPDVEKALARGWVVRMDDRFLYRTSVVYTGVKLTRIGKIDMRSHTFEADFYLWFRYHGEVAPERIEFTGAVEPISLGAPVREKETERMSYRLYEVHGRFRMDGVSGNRVFGDHVLDIGFCHQRLPRSNLIYVTDVLGMGATEAKGPAMGTARVISPEEGWFISGVRFCQGISQKESLGHPDHLGLVSGVVDHSTFNVGVRIRKNELSIRRNLSPVVAAYLAGGALLFLLAGFVPGVRRGALLPAKALAAALLLLSGEVVCLKWFPVPAETYSLDRVVILFDILWWVVPAAFLVRAIEAFVWRPLEARTGRNIPNLVRRFVAFLVWLLTFFTIIAFVFDQKITSLLATSGIITMIIGLAIQVNISNIFSGIAINLERPFQIGDFIQVNDLPLGRVVDITWRTTRIMTSANNIVNIPNSMASEAVIENCNRPDEVYEICSDIHLAPHHPPEKVERILINAMLGIDGVVKAEVLFQFTAWACTYSALFYLKDLEKRQEYQHRVARKIWEALAREGIRPVSPGSDILSALTLSGDSTGFAPASLDAGN